MKRSEFEHVIKAAANITDDEIVVIGSQAILGQFPDAPPSLLRSIEADVYPRNHPERAGEIDGAIGDGSRFHETWGYYAHGVGPETPRAPAGWEGRMIRLDLPATSPRRKAVTAWCIEAHDLALAKLAAGRPKDIDFVTEALKAALIDSEQLLLGLELMPAGLQPVVRERLDIVFATAAST